MTTPAWLTQLISNEIDHRIENDQRTTASTFLGWPRNEIFRDVIGGGQADFNASIGHLSGDDRALLYAKYNQGRHLDELRHAFAQLLGDHGIISRPTVIDLGCGPFTAGLSFATSLGSQEPFRYFGVDRATSMLNLGALLAERARECGALHPQTTCWFGDDLERVDFGPTRGEWTLVVASYLLASPTVDVASLVASILKALSSIGPGPAAVFYTNSANRNAGAKYPAFRDALVQGGFELAIDDFERFADTNKSPKDVHYALLYRPAKTTIQMKGRTDEVAKA